jgi:hypothetical protein
MITAYTGKQLDTWWGSLVIAVDGMQAKQKIPVLREHRRDRVVGFGATSREKSNFYVNGEFSQSTPDAREVQDLADEGYPWQGSVGVWPLTIKVLENAKATETVNGRKITGPAEIWLTSEVGEVSFVSMGRDDDTAAIALTESEGKVPVRIERSTDTVSITQNVLTNNKENFTMDLTLESLQKEAPELLAQIEDAARQQGIAQGQTDGIAAERGRVVEILHAEADPTETRRAIEDGTDAHAAFKQFYEAEKDKRASGLVQLEKEAEPPAGAEAPDSQLSAPKTQEQLRSEWRPAMGPAAA